MTPNTSIIIPCYMLPDKDHELLRFTRQCIASIGEHLHDYELILIDNGSPVDGDYLREQADIYIRNRTNLGFGPAVNQGLRIARGQWLVVSNNDITFLHDWVSTAIDAWDERTGIISSHLHDHDPEHRAGRQVAPWGHFFGALWMVSREVLSSVGYIDESFERGMFEDKDLVRRVIQSGHEHIKVGWCRHVGNATWGKLPNQQEIYIRNRDYFNRKWAEITG